MNRRIEITGKDTGDAMVREAALKKLNSLQTDELVKLSKMCSEKGRKLLSPSLAWPDKTRARAMRCNDLWLQDY